MSYGLTPYMQANGIVNKTWLGRRLYNLQSFKQDRMGARYAVKRVWDRAMAEELLLPYTQTGVVSDAHRVVGKEQVAINYHALKHER